MQGVSASSKRDPFQPMVNHTLHACVRVPTLSVQMPIHLLPEAVEIEERVELSRKAVDYFRNLQLNDYFLP